MHFCVCFQNTELQRQMAYTVLSAFVSLYIQAAKTDNQPHVLQIVQSTYTLKKKKHIKKVLHCGKHLIQKIQWHVYENKLTQL